MAILRPKLLSYEVRQLYLDSEEMYFLPLPKLNTRQLELVRTDLTSRGFRVTGDGRRLRARKGDDWFVVSPTAGLAWSQTDTVDSIVPTLMLAMREPRSPTRENPYYAVKKDDDAAGYELHFFPRLEGLGRWDSLRSQGASGLTPDEALMLASLFTGLKEPVDCITDYPTDGCSVSQVGRSQFYRSRMSGSDFAANLRTISSTSSKNVYLPRSSIIRTSTRLNPLHQSTIDELGQWCYLEFHI